FRARVNAGRHTGPAKVTAVGHEIGDTIGHRLDGVTSLENPADLIDRIAIDSPLIDARRRLMVGENGRPDIFERHRISDGRNDANGLNRCYILRGWAVGTPDQHGQNETCKDSAQHNRFLYEVMDCGGQRSTFACYVKSQYKCIRARTLNTHMKG